MVVDAFPFNNELDLLRLRIDYLADHVDHFVVVESPRTFTGQAKPLHLTENIDSFADVADRLTIATYDAGDDATAWDREKLSRAAIRAELAAMPPNHIALLGDVDEFPSRSQLANLREIESLVIVPLETFYRRANWLIESNTPWVRMAAVPVGQVPADLHEVRAGVDAVSIDGEPGAHLSFMGFGPEELADKLMAFSHTEYQFAASAAAHVLEVSDHLALDHFGRCDLPGWGVLRVIRERDERELHRWLRPRCPEWFAPRPLATQMWREMNAAVIDYAMQTQDATLLGQLGARSTLKHPAAYHAIRIRARRFAGRIRHRRRSSSRCDDGG